MRPGNLAILSAGNGQARIALLPEPAKPAGSSVSISMIRSPINPADILSLDGQYAFDFARDDPLGAEGVARVDEVGQEVKDLLPGDLVLPLTRGNWVRRRTVDRRMLVRLPKGVDLSQAAMLRINPATAYLLLESAKLAQGDVLVQNAAGSSVAAWVRLFAGRRNIDVIDVVRTVDAALPNAILDGPGLAGRVGVRAAGRPVAFALDCVAGEATGRLAECLALQGSLIVFGHLSGSPISVRSQLLTGRGLALKGFSLRPAESQLEPARLQAMFAEIFACWAEIVPRPPVSTVLPVEQVDEALALARSGVRGRVLLDLSE